MPTRRREKDADEEAAAMADHSVVFVDTNLDTHLAMLVCTSDTISDFKKKVALEHMQCFPEIGEIQVHSVKVKHRSNFYHMPDIMHVWSAFRGIKRDWFLSVDASSHHIHTCGINSGGMTNIDNDTNVSEPLPLALPTEKNPISEIIANVEKPTENSHKSIYSEDHYMIAESHAKKRHKVRHIEDTSPNPSFGVSGAMFTENGEDGKPTMSDSIVKNIEGRLLSEGTSLPTMASQNLNSNDTRKEDNGFDSMMDYGLGQDVPTRYSGLVSITALGSSSRIMGANGEGGHVNTSSNKRKKTKLRKTPVKILDTTDMEQIVKDESIKECTDSLKCDKIEEGKSFEHDGEVDADLALKEASLLQDTEKGNFSIGIFQEFIDSNERKEDNVLESKTGYELHHDDSTMRSGGCTKVPDLSARLMDAGGGTGDFNPEEKKRKKKKAHKTVAKVQDTRVVQQIEKGEMEKLHTETVYSEEKEELKCFLEHDNEVILPSYSKTPDHDPDLALEEKSFMQDADAVVQPEISSGTKMRKKSKVQNTVIKVQDKTDGKQIGEGECIEPTIDTHECDKIEEVNGVLLKHDHVVTMPSNSRVPSQDDPDLALTEESLWQDAEKSNFSNVISQKHLDCNGTKEDNVSDSIMDHELDQNVPKVHLGGIFNDMPDTSVRLMVSGFSIRDLISDGEKRKKKKIHKSSSKVLDTRHLEQIGKSEMKNPLTETIDSEKKDELEGLSLEHDNEVIVPSDSKAPDHVDPDLALNEASFMPDVDAVVENEIATSIKKRKKKKRGKTSEGTSIQNLYITEINNGIRGSLGLPSLSSDRVSMETGKEESLRLNEIKDIQMKLCDGFDHDVGEKVWDENTKEADLEIKTQTEQTSEHVAVINGKMREKTKSSAGVRNTDFTTAETENAIMESNRTDKDSGNTENRDRKTTKKRKKQKHIVVEIQENFPDEDQQIDGEPLATKVTSVGFDNSEQADRDVDSSQLLSRRGEEKADKVHKLVVNTDDLAENPGKGTEGINLKEYFVPDKFQNEVDTSDKIRKGTELQRYSDVAKDNHLTTVNIPTELQNFIKSLKHKKPGNNSSRKDSVRIKCKSTRNSDWDQVSPNSFKSSSDAPGIEVKDSSPSKLCEMTLQNPTDIVAASCIQHKNPSLDKSSSERSKTLHSNWENKSLLSALNVTNMKLLKSPKKKILLVKYGEIFQHDSGESSGDENGSLQSNEITRRPSDSSSMSGDSAGESELSQNSTSKGCNDAKRSTRGRRNTSKLDMSALKDLKMDSILRSSKRFKKAKEMAIECVPDSQLS